MTSKRSAGSQWHADVFTAADYICCAETHDPRCDGFADHAHHIVYKWRCTAPARYLFANGIALSEHCHQLAHASHGASLSQARLDRAVAAVNAVQGNDPAYPEFRIPPFHFKGLAESLPRG